MGVGLHSVVESKRALTCAWRTGAAVAEEGTTEHRGSECHDADQLPSGSGTRRVHGIGVSVTVAVVAGSSTKPLPSLSKGSGVPVLGIISP